MELIFLTEKLLRQYYKLVIYNYWYHFYANPSDDTIALRAVLTNIDNQRRTVTLQFWGMTRLYMYIYLRIFEIDHTVERKARTVLCMPS